MSAGLMSCVRENSPPLELDDSVHSQHSGMSIPPNTPETQKRRRFLLPLRNLRRIFRRRTVAHADTITPQTITHDDSIATQNLINTNTLDSSISSDVGVKSNKLLVVQQREHSADGLRQKELQKELDRDMADYQRSLSEGRLMDGELNRDTLSQSHDSVFSESATANSFSSVIKAELVDVLRKRRIRPDASDEDLGLPKSPSTPQKKERNTSNNIHQSDGSLISIASSDMDDDTFGSNSNYSSKISSDLSRNLDEVDLDLSTGARLSHSAAKHKMAIRPKKKGPTRLRRPIDPTVLPSTPEVNEDFAKITLSEMETSVNSMNSSYSGITTTTTTTTKVMSEESKLKSQSLPPGVNAKIIEKHSLKVVSSEKSTALSQTIYVNKNISKSYEFENDLSKDSPVTTLERKDEDGFFKRLLNRSSKKKKSNISISPEMDTGVDMVDSVEHGKEEIHKVEVQTFTNSIYTPSPAEPEKTMIEVPTKLLPKLRSGPASRQRVVPQDLTLNTTNIILPPKSPRKLSPPVASNESIDSIEAENASLRHKTPKIYGLSSFQQRVTSSLDEMIDKPVNRRKSVEKSKSFRFYNETTSQNLHNSNNLPSLPDLSSPCYKNDEDDDDSNEPEQQFYSIQNPPPIKFDVSDNNLTQIEENIDKIVKSTFVAMKKTTTASNNSTSNEDIDKLEKKNRHSALIEPASPMSATTPTSTDVPEFMKIQLNRVESTRPKTHVVLSKNAKEPSTPTTPTTPITPNIILTINNQDSKDMNRRFSNENVEISETKPPLPPDVATNRRSSVHKSHESISSTEKIEPVVQQTKRRSYENRKSSVSSEDTDAGTQPIEKSVPKRVSIDESITKINNIKNTEISRKSVSDDENVVVLRKKSVSSNNKDDTPELMKVFARRSLKIKDTDDFQVYDNTTETSKIIASNLDSDKENQSSSEEKLDKLPKIEITIANNNNNNNNNSNVNNNSSNVNSSSIDSNKRDSEIFRPKTTVITPKPFITSNRFGNKSNFRNSTNFVDVRKTIHTPANAISNNNNNNNVTNNGNNTDVINNNRHTISVPMQPKNEESTDSPITTTQTVSDRLEFKNILQRRAEWEKRAKEGFK